MDCVLFFVSFRVLHSCCFFFISFGLSFVLLSTTRCFESTQTHSTFARTQHNICLVLKTRASEAQVCAITSSNYYIMHLKLKTNIFPFHTANNFQLRFFFGCFWRSLLILLYFWKIKKKNTRNAIKKLFCANKTNKTTRNIIYIYS